MQVGFREPQSLKLVREQTAPLPGAHMMIAPEQAQIMALLTRLLGVRRYLEIGTYTGYSALAVALAMQPDGQVVTCEIDEAIATTAKRHWRHAGVADRIELRLGPALEILDAMLAQGRRGYFDMAFIDADKENLLAYYERCHALMRVGGVILIDNTLWPSISSFTRISASRWCCCLLAMA
jgi:predicted O-methyltransferase YrrM